MGVLRIADSCQRFPPSDPLSPTAMNILRDNLVALDEATRLGGYVFTGLYGQQPTENDEQNQIVWRGGGVWRTGMNTLRLTTHTTGTVVSGDTLRIHRGDITETSGGAVASSTAFHDVSIAAGTQTHTISLSGFADGDVLRFVAEVRHASDPPAPYTGVRTHVVLAELLPVTLPDAAPTLPTFASAADLTQTKLNQLCDYVDWLIRRVGTRYDPLFISHLRRHGPFNVPGFGTDPNIKWYGGLRRSALHATLRVRGRTLRVWTGATEQVRLILNGSVVATHNVPTSLGETLFTFDQSLASYATDSVIRIELDYIRSAPAMDDMPINHWIIHEMYVDAPSGGAASLGAWAIRQAGVSDAALVAWASSARTLAQAIKDRIDQNGPFWGVQRLYTMRPATSLEQLQGFEELAVPLTWRRQGDALVGRGRALSLGYGAGWFDEAEYKERSKKIQGHGAWPLKNTRTHTVVDGDNVESFQLFLDDAPGLPIGAPYNVRGWESYVLMERLKVVE